MSWKAGRAGTPSTSWEINHTLLSWNIYTELRPLSWATTKNPIAESCEIPDFIENPGAGRKPFLRDRYKKGPHTGKLGL